MEPESVGAVLCDPPHAILRSDWDVLPDLHLWKAVFRALRPGGPALVICAPKRFHRIAVDLENAGFGVEDMLIWAFATGKPPSLASLKPAHVPILVARKPGPRMPIDIDNARVPYLDEADAEQTRRIDTLRATGRRRPGIYDCSLNPSNGAHPPFAPKAGRWPSTLILTEPLLGHHDRFFLIPKTRTPNGHPAAKPVELIVHLLKLYTPRDALVLDPFAGGGSTGVAAILSGRQALLIEREHQFAELARQNLAAARKGDFGLPKRVKVASFLGEDDDTHTPEDTTANEALRYPTERATLDMNVRLDTPDEMAARLGICRRTLRRRVLDQSVLAISTGRGVRFDAVATLARLKKQGEANDGVVPRQKGEYMGSAGSADRSGQTEAPQVPTHSRKPNRRTRRGEEDGRGSRNGDREHPPRAGIPAEEDSGSNHVGLGSQRSDDVATLRAAADTARLLLGPRRPPSEGNL
jgi:site-specific DNA-methyltransferase (adenine-specific)